MHALFLLGYSMRSLLQTSPFSVRMIGVRIFVGDLWSWMWLKLILMLLFVIPFILLAGVVIRD